MIVCVFNNGEEHVVHGTGCKTLHEEQEYVEKFSTKNLVLKIVQKSLDKLNKV